MGKKDKLKKQLKAAQREGVALGVLKPDTRTTNKDSFGQSTFEGVDIKVGKHTFRCPKMRFDDYKLSDYPMMKNIPDEFKSPRNPFHSKCSDIFFGGGRLTGEGFTLKEKYSDQRYKTSVIMILQSMLQSFEPPHELKMAASAYFLSGVMDYNKTSLI
jgi:hypothetical protein